jgi:hypothetical protein
VLCDDLLEYWEREQDAQNKEGKTLFLSAHCQVSYLPAANAFCVQNSAAEGGDGWELLASCNRCALHSICTRVYVVCVVL